MPKKQKTEDKNELAFKKFLIGGRHTYRQEGPYLVCKTCELHHAVHIGIDKIMVGEDKKGKPIIKNKSDVL
jgi:hypothetical protein